MLLKLPRHLNSFYRQGNVAGSLGFGAVLIDALILGVKQIVIDFDTMVFKINLFPFKPQDFSTPTAGYD